MANSSLSNRERAALRKAIPKAPRKAKGPAEVRVGKPVDVRPQVRDGLEWELGKGRITVIQFREGMRFREGFRAAGEVGLRSCLDVREGRGGGGKGALAPVEAMTLARAEMLVIRYEVLRGQDDMLTVMDGVCGLGFTCRALANGDRRRADDLEVALRLALDLVVGWRIAIKKAA